MKNKILLAFIVCFVAGVADAQIRAYDPKTGESMSLESLVDSGAIPVIEKHTGDIPVHSINSQLNKEILKSADSKVEMPGEDDLNEVYLPSKAASMTASEKKAYARRIFAKRVAIGNDMRKPFDQKRITNLGSVFGFATLNTYTDDMKSAMNNIGRIQGIRYKFYLKSPDAMASLTSFAVMVGEGMEEKMSLDRGNVARRMHVTDYPIIIYKDYKLKTHRFPFSSAGVKDLRMKIGEMSALKEAEELKRAYDKARASEGGNDVKIK